MVKAIEAIKEQRDEMSAIISKQHEEKCNLEQQISVLNERLALLNRTLKLKHRFNGRECRNQK